MMESNYWKNFYKEFNEKEPSDFVKWVAPQLPQNDYVADVGCGNGRDSDYLRSLGFRVTSIDSSETRYKHLIVRDCSAFWYGHNTVYCRWLLHALTEVQQHEFLSRIAQFGTGLFLECRSDKDDISPKIENHFRRPINKSKLEDELKSLGFWINYSAEQRGWSKVGDDDPLLIRIKATH